jgi:hypothetical protein
LKHFQTSLVAIIWKRHQAVTSPAVNPLKWLSVKERVCAQVGSCISSSQNQFYFLLIHFTYLLTVMLLAGAVFCWMGYFADPCCYDLFALVVLVTFKPRFVTQPCGITVAQAVNRRLPTMAARIQS